MNDDINKYKDIINLPHHISKRHPQMSIENRAAQFAPFAALTGYSDEIKETARLTDKRIELDEEEKEKINEKIRKIIEKLHLKPKVEIIYFIPDLKKEGGKYITIKEKVKKVKKYERKIIMENCEEINIDEIVEINII